ncbi:hypothetical protein [Actinoplanes sp. NPDC051859]|uniref:hypothetical protein n=1 Tax=Actinoplanes sp. NPDC051859 TaxID=3363909 RepID=UPI0037B02264
MDLGMAMLVVGGGIGLLLAIFGAKMLVTGRAPAGTLRNFPSLRTAALYHLLFGVALLVMVVGQVIPNGPARAALSAFAIVLVVVALLRYRPRRSRPSQQT